MLELLKIGLTTLILAIPTQVAATTSIPIYNISKTVEITLEATSTTPTLSIPDLIEKYALEAGLSSKDVKRLQGIATCESSNTQFKTDGSVYLGEIDPRDTGIMQINTGYHGSAAKALGLDITKTDDNIIFAVQLYKALGSVPWNPSRPCWIKDKPSWN